MDTPNKPRARKVNAHWAAMEMAGLRFHLPPETSSVCRCPLCDDIFGEEHCQFHTALFEDLDAPLRGDDEQKAELMSYQHARKGSWRDQRMGNIIAGCPRLKAAIEAAALAATVPEPAPAAAPQRGRL